MSSEKIIHVTDGDFADNVLGAKMPVLVDYWADWCGPCKAIAPALDQLADEYDGRVVIAKLNIDDNPEVPMRYAVRGIPTLMLFVDGEVAATKVGAASKAELASFLDEHVA